MPSAKKSKAAAARKPEKPPSTSSAAATDASPSAWDANPRAFYFLTAGPPMALLLFGMPYRAATIWFIAWTFYQYLPLPKQVHALGARALTVYASYQSLDERLVPHDAEDATGIVSMRLFAACGFGLVMGVAYRNALKFLAWLVSDLPERPTGGGDGASSSSSSATADDPRPSVCVSLSSGDGETASMSRSQEGGASRIHLTGAPPNVHGDGDFLVKVQLPIVHNSATTSKVYAQGMVYDERRSFQAFVDLESEAEVHTPTLARLIATEGGSGGVKAYFNARREGDVLRIFVDRVMPPPGGW